MAMVLKQDVQQSHIGVLVRCPQMFDLSVCDHYSCLKKFPSLLMHFDLQAGLFVPLT